METIRGLIENTKKLVENKNSRAELTGNKMDSPIIISTNIADENDLSSTINNFDIIREKFEKIWPRSYDTPIYLANSLGDDCLYDISIKDKNYIAVSAEEIQQKRLKPLRAKREKDFSVLAKWAYYNIINTMTMKNLRDFETQYNFVDKVDEIIDTKSSSIAFIIIDDTYGDDKKNLFEQIKTFLTKDIIKYDSVFVLTNSSNFGNIFDYEIDILPAIATVIILSNLSSEDTKIKDKLRKISGKFYDKKIYTVTHSTVSKPIEEISCQLIDEINKNVEGLFIKKNSDTDWNIADWKNVLEIENDYIRPFEEFLSKDNFNLDFNKLLYLPLKNVPTNNIDFEKDSANYCLNYFYPESFNEYITSFCDIFKNDVRIIEVIKEYEKTVYQNIGVNRALNEKKIESIISDIRIKEPDNHQNFKIYLSNYIKYFLRKEVFLNTVEELLNNICKYSKKTQDDFEEFIKEFNKESPVTEFDQLSDMYKNMVETYCSSPEGQKNLKYILKPKNSFSDFINGIYLCIKEIVNDESNLKIFQLSLVDEWQKRLSNEGDEVYEKINKKFSENFGKRMFFNTNTSANSCVLEIYLLHTNEADDKAETELYKKFKGATKEKEVVEYINTGFNDTVELIRLIDIKSLI